MRASTPSTRSPLPLLSILVATLLASAPAATLTCRVPGSHPTVQSAVTDGACSIVELAPQVFSEEVVITRSLTLTGATEGGTVIEGPVRAFGDGVSVVARSFRVESGCAGDALAAGQGASLDGEGIESVRSAAFPCPPLFADGFESGGTTAWSAWTP